MMLSDMHDSALPHWNSIHIHKKKTKVDFRLFSEGSSRAHKQVHKPMGSDSSHSHSKLFGNDLNSGRSKRPQSLTNCRGNWAEFSYLSPPSVIPRLQHLGWKLLFEGFCPFEKCRLWGEGTEVIGKNLLSWLKGETIYLIE